LGGAASQVIEGNIIRSNATGIAMFAAGSPLIRNSIIQGSGGDGLNMVNQSDATIVQCEIYENGANGINWLTPSGTRGPWVINCTIFNNHSAGIYADGYDAGARIMNSILMGSPALSVGGFNDNNPPIVQYNDIYSRTGAAYAGLISDLTGTAGNISADPLFVCEPSRDFHLLAGSPALDRGTNGAPNVASLDFDGFPRVMDGDTNGVAVVDLGAFELNPAALPQPCLYVVCPSNINVTAPQGQNFAVVNYPTPTATPSAALVTSPASGSAFPSGTTIVTSTATYGTNSVNCSFNVTVSVWPAIVSQPQSTNTLAGRNFSLSVTATGTAPLSYSWNFEGVAIAGATGTTLTVTNAQAANEGVYRVVAANAAGAVSSSAALVRVLPSAPLIVSGPSSLSIPSGSNATFNVSSIGSAPIFYQWLKGGVPLPGATTSQLTVFNAQLPDAGGYQVVVSNATGSATSTVASLSITPAAPAFVLQPLDKAVNAGTNTSLIAQARGSEPIVYQWRQNGVILSGATQTTLNLSNVTITSSGTYDVVATNVYGMATSGVAIVTVSQKPTLLSGLTNQIVDVGSTVILPVAASGSGILTYFWQFNGALLANTNSSLTLSNIQIFQSGYYRVTVSNTLGTISTTGRISVVNVSSRLVVWGDNSGGQLNVPVNLNDASLVAGGDYHSLALRHDGTLLAWGYAGDGQTAVPTNALKFVTIAAGAAHNLAVTEAGSVSAWGRNESGQTNVPVSATNVVAVAAGDSHSLALLSSGNLLAWGNNAFGQGSAVQFSGIRAIAAGRNHNLALRTNGTVSAWGYNAYGQASPPQTLTGVAAISAGYLHSVALLTNRTVVCWGDNSFGQTNQPAGLSNVVSVAAGDFHTFALRSDGSVVAWGDNSYGQTALPVSLSNSVFVASGNYHGLALVPSMVLQYRKDTSGLVLQWSGPGVLQRAASLSGPYQDVTGSPGPYTNHSTPAPGLFFRLRSP
jgi:alpha-tubulin suppressor-like RCC1 family protein